jgi:Cu/Zn superoxide dismutase
MKLLMLGVAIAAAAAGVCVTEAVRAASNVKVRAFTCVITSGQEAPAVNTTGFGVGFFTLNEADKTLTYSVTYHGLTGNPTGAHVHSPGVPGVDGPILFALTAPAAVDGNIAGTSSPLTPADVKNLEKGLFYVNLHTTANPGGEIRGQILPSNTTYKVPATQ